MLIVSSHVVDSVTGWDAAGIRVRCQRLVPLCESQAVAEVTAGDDGRIAIEVETDVDPPGTCYEVVFYSGEYFATRQQNDDLPSMVSEVVIRLDLSFVQEHCHVPMMIAPHNYSVWWSR
jgi:5-hydroxyisourate hydrolase